MQEDLKYLAQLWCTVFASAEAMFFIYQQIWRK